MFMSRAQIKGTGPFANGSVFSYHFIKLRINDDSAALSLNIDSWRNLCNAQ